MLDTQRQQLATDGYTLLAGLLQPPETEYLALRLDELWRHEGSLAGVENYLEKNAWRLANLADKDQIFVKLLARPAVLEAVEAVIGPNIRVSMMNARAVPPRSDPDQPLHTDTRKHGVADSSGYYVCTVIWMLDDFTRANGATRLVPGTHRSYKVPKDALADPGRPHPDEIVIEGRAGDVLVFNGHCWHAGGRNDTDAPRRAILVHYIRADHPQEFNQKEGLSAATKAALDPGERRVLGLDD
jgi:ectoine hydroxylase-related dioxygenase (phytanoyl-CoA dioxygenase family)